MREVSPFDEVQLAGFGTVNILVGVEQAVYITTDGNLLQHVDTYVENGRLRIRPQHIQPRAGLTVDIMVPQLTSARVSGAGDIHVDGAHGDFLDMSVSGAGTLAARGQVKHISTSISGAGDADLRELQAQSAEVRISGAGSAHVNASEHVDAKVSGAGNVVCHGNPTTINQQISGVGSVTRGRFETVAEVSKRRGSAKNPHIPVSHTLSDR